MAQQQNGHLTIEQLSALLDKQLSTQEAGQVDAHLRACQQCQGQLNDLRQTVALLHALPQPALPRSFVLTPEMLSSATQEPAIPVTIQLEERRRQRQQRQQGRQGVRTLERSQTRRTVLPRTLRAMSTLVALLGFIFLVSALPFHIGGGASSTGSSYGTSSPAATPSSSAVVPHTITKPGQGNAPEKKSTATHQPTATGSSPSSLFDPYTPGGRAIDGLILLALALMGLVLTRWWRVRTT